MIDTKDFPLLAANVDKFHNHLDECRQCRDNPFALCAKGHELLTGEKVDDNDRTATFHDRIVLNFLS